MPSSHLPLDQNHHNSATFRMRVTFSDTVTTFTIPAMEPSMKQELFYDKVDIQRMQMREQIRKEKILAKRLIRMIERSSNAATPPTCKADNGLVNLPMAELAALQVI